MLRVSGATGDIVMLGVAAMVIYIRCAERSPRGAYATGVDVHETAADTAAPDSRCFIAIKNRAFAI